MHDRPTIAELVEAVREYLERDVMTAADRRIAFHGRVAANILGMVERELALGEGHARSEHAQLVKLLGHGGTIPDLTAELARGIRDGSLDDRRTDVLAHVTRSVRAKLEVANPKYLE